MSDTPRSAPPTERRRPLRGHGRALAWAAVGVGVVLAGLLAGAIILVVAPGFLQGPLYDNRPSGVACADLPAAEDVERALAEHPDLVRRIEAVGEAVWVEVSVPCADSHPDRAEVLVTYPGGQDRQRIEEILEDESFGVPTSLRNV